MFSGKANVLEVSKFWREIITNLSKEYPDVELTHQLLTILQCN